LAGQRTVLSPRQRARSFCAGEIMKAADLVILALCVVLAGGAFAGFYWWQGQRARAQEAAYEAGIDRIVDSKVRAVGLAFVTTQLEASSDRMAALQALYAEPGRADQLNLGFGTLQGDFFTSYAEYAVQEGRTTERDRFQREVDERWGEGAFAAMTAHYQAFVADAPRRLAEQHAQLLQDCLAHSRGGEDRRACHEGHARAQAAIGLTP
jgi:hypothetical protein